MFEREEKPFAIALLKIKIIRRMGTSLFSRVGLFLEIFICEVLDNLPTHKQTLSEKKRVCRIYHCWKINTCT